MEEVRMHKGLQVSQSDLAFTLDVDVRHDGYGDFCVKTSGWWPARQKFGMLQLVKRIMW